MFKEDLELREKVFRKMGWVKRSIEISTGNAPPKAAVNIIRPGSYLTNRWIEPNGEKHKGLPPTETTWEVCAKYLVPFMRDTGGIYYIQSAYFFWRPSDQSKKIVNDNIARAACEAFLEVELG